MSQTVRADTDFMPTKPKPRRYTRRAFIAAGVGTLLAGGSTAAYARYVEPYWATVETVDMDIPNLPDQLEGRRIVHLTDLHLCRKESSDYLRRQIDRVAELDPEIVFLTGDYITGYHSSLLDRLVELVSKLRTPAGVWAVLGNHDWGVYSGWRSRNVGPLHADRVTETLEKSGITVLRNQSARIDLAGQPVQIVGLEDLWSNRCHPPAAFAGIDYSQPTIVLAHNPDTIDLLDDVSFDWLLCGHTHGGQVRIPFYGAPMLPIHNRQYDAGRFEIGSRRLYVNRGLGHTLPVRFNCRPEITQFILRRRR